MAKKHSSNPGIRLKWGGSLAAQREHDEACAAHPPKLKREKKRKKRKTPKPSQHHGKHVPYAVYLQSAWWALKRKQKLKSTRWKCERCLLPAQMVHHKHYRTLWREKNADLESICRACHESHHEALVQADNHLRAIAGN